MCFRLSFSAQLHRSSVALFSLGLLQSSIFLFVFKYTQFILAEDVCTCCSFTDALPVFNNIHMVESSSFKSHIRGSLTELPCILLRSLGNRSLQESINGLSTLLGNGRFLDF